MGQFKSLERRLPKNGTLQTRYQETIDTDVKAGYARKLEQFELNETRDKLQCYLPHYPFINPPKHEKSMHCSSKVQGEAMKDKLLYGPDLLHSLIGIMFRCTEHQIALSADIEAMFLQVAHPSDDHPIFLISQARRSRAEDRSLRVFTTRYWIGANSLSTCAIYALHQVAKDN
ncbi:uncharacterized protein LOC142340485 [Convolutriloba macropyga]|uniref:uncharacterized protein LOC142340485 n=1 Tax=Convolutriloba macropyga TaxID=536237 RepID=UPI003F524239